MSMWRRFVAALIAACIAWAPAQSAAVLKSAGGIAGGGALANVPYDRFGTAIAMVGTPTGTMGNNGAMTMGTANDLIYPHGYYFMPAGSIAAGVPAAAAWYYGTASSTTAVTLFNNTYDPTTGVPPTVPASPTAFVTTGPGAFTGDTSEETVFQIAIAANSLGPNGELRSELMGVGNNTAGTKTYRQKFGATTHSTFAISTQLGAGLSLYVKNAGAAAKQIGYTGSGHSGTTFAASTAGALGTSDTTGAINYVVTLQRNTATDIATVLSFALVQQFRP
jgi:hypothetical protein